MIHVHPFLTMQNLILQLKSVHDYLIAEKSLEKVENLNTRIFQHGFIGL